MRKIVLSGGTSRIGHYLLKRLPMLADTRVTAVSRRPHPRAVAEERICWVTTDVGDPLDVNPLEDSEVLVHCAPLWILPAWLDRTTAKDLRRVIAFSSTSRFSKADSAHPAERAVAAALAEAEQSLEALAASKGFHLTIFRPTLIYGDGLDKNIAVIARLIERLGFFPVVGTGSGLRMPVHAADLAEACLLALDNPNTFNQSYNLSGAEPIAYREMVERIFQGLDRRPRILSVPPAVLRVAVRVAAALPRFRNLTPEMASRMMVDLVFEHDSATRDFGYAPREFHPGRGDLVPTGRMDRPPSP